MTKNRGRRVDAIDLHVICIGWILSGHGFKQNAKLIVFNKRVQLTYACTNVMALVRPTRSRTQGGTPKEGLYIFVDYATHYMYIYGL